MSLEDKVGKIRIKINCDHRKANDFTYHFYSDKDLEINAWLCSGCILPYKRILTGYQQTKNRQLEMNDDDGFDEDTMSFPND